ncbi:MAG: redoxin domain-containing protein, partial [Calditrichaeota bacterium]|nr:redoxin domain-containing protein [Calditrichota bacterium]
MTPDIKESILQVGDKIPDISLPDQSGVELNLGSLKGEPFILYFYPKDNTPG